MKLYTDHAAIEPGGKLGVAIEIQVEKHWHFYHSVILDGSGLPTEFSFTLPDGYTAGEVRFPQPSLLTFRDSEYLGYEDNATFFVEITAPPNAAVGNAAPIGVSVKGLVCNDEKGCVTFRAESSLTLDVRQSAGAATNAEKFDDLKKSLTPRLADGPKIEGSSIKSLSEKVAVHGRGALALMIKIAPKHHMQAPDPGAEGLIGARVFVESIDGISFDEPIWPKPRSREMEGVGTVNEYAGDVTVTIPFSIKDANFKLRPIDLMAVLSYQICDDRTCYPPEMVEGRVHFEVVAEGAAPDVAIDAAPAPKPAEGNSTGRKPRTHVTGDGLPWQKWEPGLPEKLAADGKLVYVDFTAEWCATCKQNKNLVLEVNPVRARLLELGAVMLEGDFTHEDPTIKSELMRFQRAGVPLNLIYAPGHPKKPLVMRELLTSSYVLGKLDDAMAGRVDVNEVQFFGLGIFGVFLFAFLGGVVLNVMPCVLPVLSLKLFSLMQQAEDEPERIFRLGLVYGAGILVSFIPLAVLMVGGGIAWGGLMQNQIYVIAMAAITFAFALSMLGVWELRLPGVVENVAGAVTTREGYGGSFINGFMATALATPCVGPFLGPAVGFLVTLPPVTAGLGIMTVGLGLAFPMVLLTTIPTWQRFLPKPGKWMVTFKQVMGFTLIATVLWLLRTLRYLGTPNEMLAILTLLFGVAIACWTLGKITLSDGGGRRMAIWTVAIVMLVGSWYAGRYIFPPDTVAVAAVTE